MATDHFWVELQFMPVTIEVDDDNNVTVMHEEGAEQVAKDESIYTCWFCPAVIRDGQVEAARTECQGQDAAKEVQNS